MPGDWESQFRGAVAGVIEAGAQVRADARELWAELRPRLAESGLPVGQAGFRLVQQMWSDAVARRNGAERFQRARPTDLFTQNMAAPDMAIRSAEVRAVIPQFMVRFDLTYVNAAGDPETRTVSLRDSWRPGMTVGDVLDAVGEAAEGLGNDYGQGMLDVANLRPVTI